MRAGYGLAEDVLLVDAPDGSGRLLDLGGSFYSMSPSAALMLKETLAHGPADAATRVAAYYRVEPGRVAQDLAALLGQLERRRLVAFPDAPRRRAAKGRGLARPVLHRLLDGACWPRLSLRTRTRVLLGLSFFAIRWLRWPATVGVFEGHRRARPALAGRGDAGPFVRDVAATLRAVAARYPLPIACKERALSCWLLLRWEGLPARLVVGVSMFPLESHCWCELDGRVVGDFPDRCERFTPVMAYGSGA